MKVSARNQLKGTVAAIKKGKVNAEVSVEIGHQSAIVAIITNGAIDHLELKEGDEVYALVKASNVIIATDVKKISTRNVLKGVVESVSVGAVNDEIIVKLSNDCTISSIITTASAKRLELEPGKEVSVVIKASSVILAKE